MKRSRAPSFTNPFLVWTRLAGQTGEMILASAQVIQHRTGRMAAAGARPSARDRRELALMGQETIEAGVESAGAMAAQTMTTSPLLAGRAVAPLTKCTAAVMSLAASRTSAQAIARHARLVRALTQSVSTATQLSGAAARTARSGLKPIHSRATANARRLSKRGA